MRNAWLQISQINFFSGSILFLRSAESMIPAEAPLQISAGIRMSGASAFSEDFSSSPFVSSSKEGSDSSDSICGHLLVFSCPSEESQRIKGEKKKLD